VSVARRIKPDGIEAQEYLIVPGRPAIYICDADRERKEGRVQREFFFDHALLPAGWARDVRIAVVDGTVVSVAQGATRNGAEHIAGVAIPGLPNLHSHGWRLGIANIRRAPPTSPSIVA
jgi:hypothetical protein